MKVELFKVINGHAKLNELFKTKMNGSVSFKVLAALKETERHLALYDDTRKKLLADNGVEPDEEGKIKIEDKGLIERLDSEFNELLKQEIELNLRTITLEELNNIESVSPEDLLHIEWLIDNGNNS